MGILAYVVIAIALFAGGAAGGIRWHAGQDAIAAQKLSDARERDARDQLRALNRASGQHATQVESLNRKLVTAHAKIRSLSGRSCLDAGTVRVLNDTGLQEPGGAAAGKPAPAASAAAAAEGDRDASDVDVAGYIAHCRTEYGKVADQLNQILDIEDRRHPPAERP